MKRQQEMLSSGNEKEHQKSRRRMKRSIFKASGKTHLKIQYVQLSVKAASLNSAEGQNQSSKGRPDFSLK